MLRTTLLASILALTSAAQADTTASCDRLDTETKGLEVRLDLDDANLKIVGEDLVLRAGGAELIHIDADRNLTVAGRAIVVPQVARADLDAYVSGFRQLEDDATSIGKQSGKIATEAIGGLVGVLFTSRTLDDYERNMEAAGAQMEQRADALCRTIAALQRTEQALQRRIPAFPNFIAPAKTAL